MKAPKPKSEQLFTIYRGDDKPLLCDERCLAVMEADGWSRSKDDAAEPAPAPAPAGGGGGQSEIRLEAPGMVALDSDVSLSCTQQVQGDPGGVVSAQFSNSEDGPWETARPIGGGGPFEAPAQQYDSRDEAFELGPCQWHEQAWVRVGVWADQGLTGPPALASNAVSPSKLVTREQGLAPEAAPEAE